MERQKYREREKDRQKERQTDRQTLTERQKWGRDSDTERDSNIKIEIQR